LIGTTDGSIVLFIRPLSNLNRMPYWIILDPHLDGKSLERLVVHHQPPNK